MGFVEDVRAVIKQAIDEYPNLNQLAKQSGVLQSNLHRWQKDFRDPRLSTIAPLMDFLDMTAEAAADTLGAADRDEWARDETGDQPRSMRQMDWEGVSLLLVYTEDRNTLLENVITVTSQALEGPRGVRVGDTLYSVINRFHHEFQQVDEQLTLLYGDGQQAPYGALTYTAGGAEVQYALTLEDGKTVTWHMNFTDGRLDEMLLLAR